MCWCSKVSLLWCHQPLQWATRLISHTLYPVTSLLMAGLFVLLKSKKNAMGAEVPSSALHSLECRWDPHGSSGKTDAIFRAAKEDLLTLMKLDVSVA